MISASFLLSGGNLKEKVELLDQTTATFIHLDIADNKFVNNKTIEFNELKDILSNVKKPLDIHLMVEDVYSYVDTYSELQPYYISFHYETSDILKKIAYIKNKGIRVGIAINPDTAFSSIIDILPLIDLVLIMSVNPGFNGQSFLNDTIDKINDLALLKDSYDFVIEVDGGINDSNYKLLNKADIKVIGSFITNGDNYQGQIDKLNREA